MEYNSAIKRKELTPAATRVNLMDTMMGKKPDTEGSYYMIHFYDV